MTKPFKSALMKKFATVYVMKCNSSICLRIGYHTTSNKQREGEVLGGSGHIYRIVRSFCFGSVLEAAAVEAVTHVKLKKTATWRQSVTIHAIPKRSKALVFWSPIRVAEKAVLEATQLLEGLGIVKRIRCR